MLETRVIPCLLLQDGGLVKTVHFKDPRYLGDPVNIIHIFNEKEVAELVILDISATPSGKGPQLPYLGELASECFMPVAYGGGISDAKTAIAILKLGIEKVVVNTQAVARPQLVTEIAEAAGSSSVVASIDVKRSLFGRYEVVTRGGRQKTGRDPVEHAKHMEAAGAGEILLNSIDRDGTMQGYDLDLIDSVSSAVNIPVVACGGARETADFGKAVARGASAAAAGSMFVFQGKHKAVLITYPTHRALREVLR